MSRESRPCEQKLNYIQTKHCSPCLNLWLTRLNTVSPLQTKRTATAGGARGIALYEDEASMSKHGRFLQKFLQILSWIPLNYSPPPSCSVLARERWRRGGGARPDSDVPHVQLPDEPSRRGCRALCSPGCHGCQWLLWPICQNVSRAGWVYVDCKCMTPEMAQM